MKLKDILAVTLVIELIVLCVAASLLFITLQSTITLLIFNALFISLIFQLHGSIIRKACILTTGNLLGLFWNLFFFNFSLTSTQYINISLDVFYTLFFPFLNLTWIVPFWSISLSLLPKKNA